MDYSNVYSFCISNANVLLKTSIHMMEKNLEQAALSAYSDYLWYKRFADEWIKGKN